MIFVINAGSSAIKYELIDMKDERVVAQGSCEKKGEAGQITHVVEGTKTIVPVTGMDPEENIQMVQQFLEQHPQFVLDETLNDCWLQVEKMETGYVQFLPFVDDMDGFFIARMLRKEAM